MSRIVAIGVGCRAGVAGEAIAALARRALEEAGAPEGERRMFTLAAKADEPGLVEAARIIGVALTPLPLAALNAQAGRILTPSAPAQARFGAPNIAEAAALAGAGEGGRLLGPRLAADGATCADRLVCRSGHDACTSSAPGRALPISSPCAGAISSRARPSASMPARSIPRALLDHCPAGARIVDTAPLDLDAIVALCVEATARGEDVARLHSGDLSIFSAMGEQLRRLKRAGVPYTVTPGVPAFAAAAAALERELTLPGLAQSLVLTRTSGRASPMPERETLANFAATGATLAIHLSIHALEDVVAELTPFYGPDCPAAVVARASWPDERIVRATLGEIVGALRETPIERTALILVGPALGAEDFRESELYNADYVRRFRAGCAGRGRMSARAAVRSPPRPLSRTPFCGRGAERPRPFSLGEKARLASGRAPVAMRAVAG